MVSVRRSSLFQLVVFFVLTSFLSVTLVAPAAKASKPKTDFTHNPEQRADATPSSEDSSPSLNREADRAVVDQALERKNVREKLHAVGFTVDEVKDRLSRLSDEEIHRMAKRIEQVKAGGHLGLNELSLAVLIVLIVLAPILAVVWVVLMVLGHDVHLHRNGGHLH